MTVNETKKSKLFSLLISFLLLFLLISNVYQYYLINKLNNTIVGNYSEIDHISLNVTTLKSKVDKIDLSQIDELNGKISSIEERSEALAHAITQLTLTNVMEMYATDKFVVEDAYIIVDSIYIDLSTQPTFQSEYEGYGIFSVSDRELKSAILSINDVIMSYCSFRILLPGKTLQLYIRF